MWNDRSLSPACSRNLPAEAASAAESLSPAEHRASRRPRHHRRGLEPELPPLLTPTVEFQPLVVLGAPEKRLQLLVRRVLLRSEEHTSELQSRLHLVCRLLLEKKKNRISR